MEANVSFRLWVPRHNPDFLKQGKPHRRMVEPGVYDENARKAAVDGILTRGGGYGVGTVRAFQISGDHRYLAAAGQAIAYESLLLSPDEGNWPDLRDFSMLQDVAAGRAPLRYMVGWCHGAPGIGLARLSSLDLFDSPGVRRDIWSRWRPLRRKDSEIIVPSAMVTWEISSCCWQPRRGRNIVLGRGKWRGTARASSTASSPAPGNPACPRACGRQD